MIISIHFELALALVLASSALAVTNTRPLPKPQVLLNNEKRELSPPFPDGPCGGTIVTLPPEDTYGIDVHLSGNTMLLPPRPISVWLPPDYGKHKGGHAVIYCHDGQNAMTDADSWTGRSWRLMGALTRWADQQELAATPAIKNANNAWNQQNIDYQSHNNSRMPIVVLLPSGEGDLLPGVRRRHLEYGEYALPFAKAHANFVSQTVKPLVDRLFQTSNRNFLIGSSMGGQASLNLMLEYPDLFDGCGCLSPFFSPTTISRVKEALQDTQKRQKLQSKKIYMDIGGDMKETSVPLFDLWDHMTEKHAWNPGYFWLDTSLQAATIEMRNLFREHSIPHCYHEIPGGRHNEMAWSKRIHLPVTYLLQD